MIDALGVKVPTIALELRREQHGISLVDLLGRIPPTACGPPDGDMSLSDLVQGVRSRCHPPPVGNGGHRPVPPRAMVHEHILPRLTRSTTGQSRTFPGGPD